MSHLAAIGLGLCMIVSFLVAAYWVGRAADALSPDLPGLDADDAFSRVLAGVIVFLIVGLVSALAWGIGCAILGVPIK